MNVEMTAELSECRNYRYSLTRKWGEGTRLVVIGLNPSTADETTDDPTIRRCIGFAKAWGHSELVMVNLFAFRATDPRAMKAEKLPCGALNNEKIIEACQGASMVLAAWGTHGNHRARAYMLKRILADRGISLHCLGKTKDGDPRHPLYIAASTLPTTYQPGTCPESPESIGRETDQLIASNQKRGPNNE